MSSVNDAVLIWLIALILMIGTGLIIWAMKRPKAPKDGIDDTPVAPHRMERLHQVHEQVKPASRRYVQKDYGDEPASW